VVFREGLESGGALLAVDRETGRPAGFTRYHDHHPERAEIEIGWTFWPALTGAAGTTVK